MKQHEIAPLNRPAKGNRICKLVKSNPNIILNVHMVDLNTKFEIYADDILRFEAKEISLMNAQSTFSSPFGKVVLSGSIRLKMLKMDFGSNRKILNNHLYLRRITHE